MRLASTLVLVLLACDEQRPEAQPTSTAPPPQATATAEPSPEPEPEPEPEPTEAERVLAFDPALSTSQRGPNDGSIQGAIALPMSGPGFRFNPRRNHDARYGTVEMVQSLMRAAAIVHQELGGELTINDLGLQQGGPIVHHGSHQAGRDVDVLFYLLDSDGEPHPPVGAPIDPSGEGTDYRDLADPDDDIPVKIDLRRTWRFVQALIEVTADDGSALQRIFVVEHLRAMLLEEAARQQAPQAVIDRFAMLTCQPSYPHDDHFHFRFYCSPQDIQAGCEDALPEYPWRKEALEALGIEARAHHPRPDRPRAPITTASEAREAAGLMHPSVRRFLRHRRRWSQQPHPGRRFCR